MTVAVHVRHRPRTEEEYMRFHLDDARDARLAAMDADKPGLTGDQIEALLAEES